MSARRSDIRTVTPVTAPIVGEPRLPGSKSLTNRALVLAALADGVSRITGALISDDTLYMANALRSLGIEVAVNEPKGEMVVKGCAGNIPANQADLYIGNAGTAARFLTPVLALGNGRYRLDGNARMRQRPIEPLLAALRSVGVRAHSEQGTGCPPIIVEANGISGGRLALDASISSQYISAILMVAPSAQSDLVVQITGQAVSEPYVAMTVGIMRAWGLDVLDGYIVPAPQLRRAREYAVEPDASAASYFMACAAITGGTIRIGGLGSSSLQGDVRFADLLAEMGCKVERTSDSIAVTGSASLRGIDVDMNDISDTVMTLAAIAPFAETPTRIRNVAHIRAKECDRIAATAAELRRLGVDAVEHPDGLTVIPSQPHGGTVRTYDDHRMAMSFALIGLRVPGIGIANPACVTKTFPGYFEELERLTGASEPVMPE